MDKQKLLGIILKDLEELKNLSGEIAEAENDASLIVDLALSKARLVVQEINLLHEYTPAIKKEPIATHQPFVATEDPEDDVVQSYSDPDLEILHFDNPEAETKEPQPAEDFKFEPIAQQESTGNAIRNKTEVEENGAFSEKHQGITTEDVPDDQDSVEEEEIVVYNEDEEEEEEDDEPEEEEEDFDLEENDDLHEIEINKLEDDPHTDVREIQIDDLDDDEAGSFKFSPVAKPIERPVLHEIPKPHDATKEKQILGEKFKKEPSLNDSIAEKRPYESKITSGPISSLRASIGLNDRFLFIREIFDNNAERYNTIIEKLDKLETIQQAVEYLKANLTLEKNDTSMKFVDLLKRRFTK